MAGKRIRCPECIYRAAKFSEYACDFAGITGHTRRAVPPERCRHFETEQPPEAAKRAKPKGPAIAINPSRRRTRYDWEKAKTLYDQKWSDSKIATAMGCDVNSVLAWRKREKLPPWPRSVQVMKKGRKENESDGHKGPSALGAGSGGEPDHGAAAEEQRQEPASLPCPA